MRDREDLPLRRRVTPSGSVVVSRRCRLFVGVLALSPWLPSYAFADVRSDFEAGRNLFVNGQYERAVEVFERLGAEPFETTAADAAKRREMVQAARPLHAASLVALGRNSEADRLILEHLRDDPFYEPPAGQLPEPVVQRFAAVAASNTDELEALRQKVLHERQEALAREQRAQEAERRRLALLEAGNRDEAVVSRRSRLVALAPFGVGQFQNGSTGLGVFFASAELAGVAASFGTMVTAQRYASADCSLEDCDAARRGFEAFRLANWITVGATSALAVAGIVEAQVALVPEERTVRRRPPTATWAPDVRVDPRGIFLGVGASF